MITEKPVAYDMAQNRKKIKLSSNFRSSALGKFCSSLVVGKMLSEKRRQETWIRQCFARSYNSPVFLYLLNRILCSVTFPGRGNACSEKENGMAPRKLQHLNYFRVLSLFFLVTRL